MTEQNPFGEGANPFGGLDLDSMMKQAQELQANMDRLQAELLAMSFDGTAAGVTVTISGGGELTDVKFAAGSLAGVEEEDLGDLVVAAFRDAHAKSTAKAQEMFGPLAQGLGINQPGA